MKKHIEAKHTEGSKEKEICSICEKTFSSKKYLRSHMKIHNAAEKSAVKKDPQNEKPCKFTSKQSTLNIPFLFHLNYSRFVL